MQYIYSRNALVITPTIVKQTLRTAAESISKQTYPNVQHLIVTDGIDDVGAETLNIMRAKGHLPRDTKYIHLPWNVGADGGRWYGHRVYASIPKLIPTDYDYVLFLDEDNWYEPDHVQYCIDALESNPTWGFSHSLRRVCDKNGKYLVNDDCESLGKWPIYGKEGNFLIDTSSYCFRRDVIRQLCHIWDFGWGGDRNFLHQVRNHVQFGCSGKYTLNYRVDGGPGSVNKEFFENGNKIMHQIYNGEYPWVKTS